MPDTRINLRRQTREPRALRLALPVIAIGAFAIGVERLGFPGEEALLAPGVAHAVQGVLLGVYAMLLGLTIRSARAAGAQKAFGRHSFEFLALAIALVGGPFAWPALPIASGLLVAYQGLQLYLLAVQRTDIPPGLVFVGSFIVLIAAGTAALLLPAATPEGKEISVIDAAFTIVSAISQTGLVVRDTGSEFTRFGQVIIMVWIQLGALGILVFGAVFALFLGSSIGLRATQTLAEPTEQGWVGQLSLSRLVAFVVILTHAIEAIGVAIFYFGWPETWEGAPEMATAGDRLFHAIFFSVSGFCNAGFVTTANSMQGLRTHWTSHILLCGLIIAGSIGFPVLNNMWEVFWARLRRRRVREGALIRLTLNTKLVLAATIGVYLFGYLTILIGELAQTEEPVSLVLFDAHFMTINRTSGFDTIAPAEMGIFSRLSLILLMFIGGSPGSVAGGIKMMVVAVLALTVWSTIRGRTVNTGFGRTLPDELVRKSSVIIVLGLATVMAVSAVLAATDPGDPADLAAARAVADATGEPFERPEPRLGAIIFEATSAFGTTGLSMGVTGRATDAGKIALMVGMFIGRVGPLAVLASLVAVAARRRVQYAYPTEGVVIY